MPRSTRPLPPLPGEHGHYATDWLTGQQVPDPVFREGKWWSKTIWERSARGRDRERDRARIRRNLAIRRFLASQSASTGL